MNNVNIQDNKTIWQGSHMVGNGHGDWLRGEERAWLTRRVGSLGFYNYNNFIFVGETYFIVK